MEREREVELRSVDSEKREFLRKLALGAAYAVPAIATFSIDSVRSKAFAQGGYGAPDVVSFRVVPTTSGDGRYLYEDPPLSGKPPSFQTYQAYTLVITFNRPMNKSYNSAKICSITDQSWECSPPPAGDPAPPAGTCPSCPQLNWNWSADGTQEFAAVPMVTGAWTPYQRITIWLNHPSCASGQYYRDTLGGVLPARVGIADLCTPPSDN